MQKKNNWNSAEFLGLLNRKPPESVITFSEGAQRIVLLRPNEIFDKKS